MKVDVNSIVESLLIKYPLFGSIIANSDFKEDINTKTASTDGRTIFYNQEFMSKLSEDEQVFVFAHEICHIAFDHIYRSENKNVSLWNQATDYVINALLKEDGLELLEGALYDPEAINYNAEQMYEKLLKEQGNNSQSSDENKENDPNNSSKDNDMSDNAENHQGHDDHSLWNQAIQDKNSNPNQEEGQTEKEEHIKKLTQVGEIKSFEKNREVRSKQLGELMDSLIEGTNGTGDDTKSLERLIDSVGTSRPLIDWRKALRESLRYDVDWSYNNATIEEGVVTAHLEERPCSVTEIVLDTSGSVSADLLKNFLRECKNIIKTSKVKVGCFDTKFYGFTEIKGEKDIDKLKFVGGGGTNFYAAINAFSKRVDNKIIFTDGCATMPNVKCNAIWVVFGGKKISPIGGKVIYINDSQFKILNSINYKKSR